MKKYLLIISLFLVFGCEKYLEIIPEYKLPAESATSHIDSLEKITVGAFNQLQSGNLFGGCSIFFIFKEYTAFSTRNMPTKIGKFELSYE